MRIGQMTISGDADYEIIRCCISDPNDGNTYNALVKCEAFAKAGLSVDVRKVYDVAFSGETHDVISIIRVNEAETERRRAVLATLL